MIDSFEEIAKKIVDMLEKGYKGHEVLIFIRDSLASTSRNKRNFSLILATCLHMPLDIIKEVIAWNKLFGPLNMTDQDIDDLLSPYIDIEKIKRLGIRKTMS